MPSIVDNPNVSESPSRRMIVDVHTHVVPSFIPEDASRGPRWPSVRKTSDDAASVIVGGQVFRAVDSRCWDVQRRLRDMEGDDTSVQVLSPMPELLSHWLAPRDAAYLAALVNDEIAGMTAVSPRRFVGIGMVAAQDPDAAAKTLSDIAGLGLCGIEIGTHINGLPLGDRRLWPLYEAAEAENLAIFVHPLHPCGLDRMGGPADVALVASFPLEIAMAAVSLIGGGVLDTFPKLRILLSHGGGALSAVLGRLSAVRDMLPAMQTTLSADPWETARRFWFDSNVYDARNLQALAERFGDDRLVVGSDYPFAIRQNHPGAFVANALPGVVDKCADNASEWLFGRRDRLRARCLCGQSHSGESFSAF